jgi:hypothetical protein
MTEHGKSGGHIISLAFVINGQEIRIDTNIEAPLGVAVQKALHDSGNTGRAIDEWEVRDASGALLDVSAKVVDLHLENGARLFVSLRVGAGGGRARRA